MNTPAHLMINLAVLGKNESPRHQCLILVGALLPDAPMFLFYFVQKVIRKIPEYQIWAHEYYVESWQNFFDCFNSLPFIALGLLVAWRMQSRVGQLLFVSMLLHVGGDLPLHHDDGHRHFFPLSNWRFESPVSYWDPSHYGHIVASLEIVVTLLAVAIIVSCARSTMTKWLASAVGAVYVVFFGYAFWMWA